MITSLNFHKHTHDHTHRLAQGTGVELRGVPIMLESLQTALKSAKKEIDAFRVKYAENIEAEIQYIEDKEAERIAKRKAEQEEYERHMEIRKEYSDTGTLQPKRVKALKDRRFSLTQSPQTFWGRYRDSTVLAQIAEIDEELVRIINEDKVKYERAKNYGYFFGYSGTRQPVLRIPLKTYLEALEESLEKLYVASQIVYGDFMVVSPQESEMIVSILRDKDYIENRFKGRVYAPKTTEV